MRVLVAIQDRDKRQWVANVLGARHHAVKAVASCDDALDACLNDLYDVVLLDWTLASLGRRRLGAVVEACHGSHGAHVIGLVQRSEPEVIRSLFAADVDDFMRMGACVEEVVGRTEAPLRQQLRRARTASDAGREFSGAFAFDTLRAWKDLGRMAAGELSHIVGATLTARPADVARGPVLAAELPVTLMSEMVEARLALGVDAGSARALGRLLYGGQVGPAGISDALREMANTVGGAFKRAAHGEGAVFALGLPTDREPFKVGPTGAAQWLLEDGSGIALTLSASVVAQREQLVPVSELAEGMVLAGDVLNASGIVLLAAGNVLTERTARRLVAMMEPTAVVCVGVAA